MNSIPAYKLMVMMTAAALCLSAADVRAETGSFEQSFDVDGPIRLDIETDSGSIEIRGGDAGQAEVIGHARVTRRFLNRSREDAEELIRRFEANPPVELSGGRLSVGRDLERDFKRYLVISYEVVVPAATEVKSRTDSGSQEISGIREAVTARADSGSLTLIDIGGPVEASADSGRIQLTNIGGSVNASADSGSIVADGVAGDFEAHADSGSVRLVQDAPGDVVVSTDSGSSELRGVAGALSVNSDSGRVTVEGRQEGEWSVETDSGSVRVYLPDDAAFKLDARSSSSGIHIDYPITMQGKISEHRLVGEVHGGGPLLKIRTDSGGIRIE